MAVENDQIIRRIQMNNVHTLAKASKAYSCSYLRLFLTLWLSLILLVPMMSAASFMRSASGNAKEQTILDGLPEKPKDMPPERWERLSSAVQAAKLLPSPNGVAGPDGLFGTAVSVSVDRALVSGLNLAGNGAVVVFEDTGTGWVESAILRPSDGALADNFGRSLSLSGDRALIGAAFDDDDGTRLGSAYVFDFDGTAWSETAKLLPADGAEGDFFGSSVSLSGDRGLVGAFRDDDNGTDSGSVYVYEFDGTDWSETGKLLATDGASGDEFGGALSLSGDRGLVGAFRDDDNGTDSGSVYVYEFDGTDWEEAFKLIASDGAAGDFFGFSLSEFRGRALIGAVGVEENGFQLGSAYVFDFDGTDWNETAKLLAADGVPNDQFGLSVSLSGDRALVGAPGTNDNGTSSGSAYVFDFDGTAWAETTKLLPADGSTTDRFGLPVSLSGNRVLIGSKGDDDDGTRSGSAYVFDFDGAAWSETRKLRPAGNSAGDRFAVSVSLSGDRALVGAAFDNNNGTDSGSAYVFGFDGTAWSETSKLLPSDGEAGDRFGSSVSLSGDRALVGSAFDGDNGFESGSAYVFNFDGSDWNESAKLRPVDGASRDEFGRSLSLFGDRALIGAAFDDDNGSSSGSTYVFDFDGLAWNETAKLLPIDGSAIDYFGSSVSLFGNRALVGALRDTDNGIDSGSAYVFDFDGTAWTETTKLLPADGAEGDFFGSSVSLSGDRGLVGAFRDDDNGTDSGSAYVYEFDGTDWSETGKLLATDGASGDEFGGALSLSGDRALIGAAFDDDNGNDSGAAYVFDFDGTAWTETAKLLLADGAAEDFFGRSVSLSTETILIGATGDDDAGTDSGSGFVRDLGLIFRDGFEIEF